MKLKSYRNNTENFNHGVKGRFKSVFNYEITSECYQSRLN